MDSPVLCRCTRPRSLDRLVKGMGGDPRHYNPTIDILLVCTGNMCRSPMAEAMLRRPPRTSGTSTRRSPRPGWWPTAAVRPRPPCRSWPTSGVRSPPTAAGCSPPSSSASSDLVVGLAREHVRETALLVPAAYPRTFTLKELVRRGGEVGARGDDESFEMWLARLHVGRTTLMHLGAVTRR